MARPHRIISSEHPYHITARGLNREWFRIPLEDVWKIFENYLFLMHHGFGVRIHSFVLMKNHFHLIASTPGGNLSEAMRHFMTEVSREITRHSSRINQTFGGPYYSSILSTYNYYCHAYKYVYRNPIEAGIVSNAESYPYSTLHGLLGQKRQAIPLVEDTILFNDVEGTLQWLNTSYKKGGLAHIRRAIKHPTFFFAKDPSTKNKIWLETERA